MSDMNGHELTQYSEYTEAKGFPKRRRRLSAVETKLLSEVFTYNQKPNAQVRKELGQKLSMTPRAVQIWFQNKRAKVKKGISSPLMDDHDPGNLFTPSKAETVEGFNPSTLPTPPGSSFLRGPVFGEALVSENLSSYPEISPNVCFWNGNSSEGTLPSAPLSFVGPRSDIIRNRPAFYLFNDHPGSPEKVSTQIGVFNSEYNRRMEEQINVKTGKEESLLVNFLHPVNAGRSMTPDLITGSSHFESYTIFRDSPDRN